MGQQLILEFNDDNFDERVKQAPEVILVDFWAAWCQPCKAIAASLDQLAEEMAGQARVAKVNVEQSGDLANRFGIRSLPTLIVFKNGKVVDQMIGAAPKDEIRRMLEKHLVPGQAAWPPSRSE